MQVLSNGIFKSVYRAVTNKENGRMSIALFWSPEREKWIGPIDELISEKRPKLYKIAKNYTEIVYEAHRKGTSALEAMKL